MHRRALLLSAPLLSAMLAPAVSGRAHAQTRPLSPADAADVTRAEAYLNSIHTLKARFFQVAPNGATSGGQAWLERPGRMRFQYDPPAPFLLVAGHGVLVFYDSQLKQTSNIPLGSTPLGILLQDNLKLSGGLTLTNVTRLPGQLQLTLQRTASPGDGSLSLFFADNPLVLRQWIVLDQQRQETRVTLLDIQLGGTFDQKLFTFIDPSFFGNGPTPGSGG